MNKVIAHLKTILTHKKYVLINCIKAGIPIRGILHDFSKFSPVEFIESVKYYQGDCSPIKKCKEENGYSKAWMHHRGRNPHHFEYWQDDFEKGGKPIQMPYKDALEMVCDYIGAGMAYAKDDFTYQCEYNYFKNRFTKESSIHPQTKMFVGTMLKIMAKENNNNILKHAKQIYDLTEKEYKNRNNPL